MTAHDDMPTPWWPCPACGGIEFRAVVLFERGAWDELDDDVYETFEPPEGRPSGIRNDDVTCEHCGHRFDIHRHYGWPEPGEAL